MKKSIIIAAIVFVNHFSFGQHTHEKINAILKKNYEKYPEVSISVGFIQKNKEYYTSYGKISKQSSLKVDKNTVFEIASVTKTLTGNLIAQASNEGKIKLNDYIDTYLPKDFVLQEPLKNKITIADLASHQSGLDDLNWKELIAKNPQNPLKDVNRQTFVSIVNNCSALPDYGSYRYHTVGIVVLGEILKNVYQKSYDEIIREKIITPLQMTNTLTKEFAIKNIATGYNRKGVKQNLMQWDAGAPAGLVKSSAKDMVCYLKALLGNNSEIAKAGVVSEHIFYKAKQGPRKIGLGINIYKDEANTFYIKTGDTMGQSSVIAYNRKDNWGIIILINQQNHNMRKALWEEIYNTVLK